jgi:hypothetical protein
MRALQGSHGPVIEESELDCESIHWSKVRKAVQSAASEGMKERGASGIPPP